MLFHRSEQKPLTSSADHWKTYKAKVQQFEELKMEASDEKDQECHKKLYETFSTCIAKGEAGESKGILAKKQLSEEATALVKKTFGEEQVLPIAGAKSLAFVKHIILPYYQDSQHIQVTGSLLDRAIISLFANAKREEYKMKAERLEAGIKLYSKDHPTLAELAQKAIEKITPAKPIVAAISG